MTAFVDTSAVYALLTENDPGHQQAVRIWDELEREAAPLVSHNYVLGETIALLQGRFGISAVRELRDRVAPALDVVWVDTEIHDAALEATIATDRRSVSFVDRTSFEIMRRIGIDRAFAFDPHFTDEGFEVLPG